MEGAKCPYCQAAYAEEDGRCKECKTPFPWLARDKELQATFEERFQEREVNRGRATLTLIEELYKAGKEGKPVSLSAIKGFAFAWIFPRTMIVIGSIVGTLILAAQTWILYQQSALLKGQTEAAQLEQTEKLRLRIGETVKERDWLASMSDAVLLNSFSTPVCDEDCPELDTWKKDARLLPQLNVTAQRVSRVVQRFEPIAAAEPLESPAPSASSPAPMTRSREYDRKLEFAIYSHLASATTRCVIDPELASKIKARLQVLFYLAHQDDEGQLMQGVDLLLQLSPNSSARQTSAVLSDLLTNSTNHLRHELTAASKVCAAQWRRDVAQLQKMDGVLVEQAPLRIFKTEDDPNNPGGARVVPAETESSSPKSK